MKITKLQTKAGGAINGKAAVVDGSITGAQLVQEIEAANHLSIETDGPSYFKITVPKKYRKVLMDLDDFAHRYEDIFSLTDYLKHQDENKRLSG